ncbi:LPS export ABC transporter periplasmic protein LptC [uncultured Desulfosarcina sp.]|uniref:LPS export ABC transporter periplasmic protein LptC n=1 Tax=uncultured Desulfosarcina sp. TaxID=218289 RepID=UPI0029C7202F|nr:LPS export ABC transporter periplasmic protein LptC [uncultured Desulfosarcina sp.]
MNRSKLIRRLLLSVAAVVLIATIGVFIGYRHLTRHPEALLERIPEEADMQLSKIHQTASKNGIREWRLEAESATLMEKRQVMVLSRPEVEFFMEDGDNLHLTADQGTIHTGSNRMEVSGQVSASTSRYRFRTETLDYDPQARELRAKTPVAISGNAFTLQADSMDMNLETSITRFEGHVKGTISEDLQL